MIVLDTNVVSELMRPEPLGQVVMWNVDDFTETRVAIVNPWSSS